MRVLVITNLFPSSARPSFGTFVASHVEALRRRQAVVDVTAITSEREHSRVARKYSKLTLILLSTLVRGPRPDVVEAHIAVPTGWLALPLARLTRSPLVLFVHGSDVLVLPGRGRLWRVTSKWLFRRADLVIANSEYMRARLLELEPGVRRLSVVSPGVRPDFFHESGEPRAGLLFVGRLVRDKGVDVLVTAWRSLSAEERQGRSLTIVGDGPLLKELRSQLKDDSSVRVTGPQTQGCVARMMRRSEVVVVPSTWEEPLGLVPLEAMASGALVVATTVGGMADTVAQGNAFGARPGDASSLAAALRSALNALSCPTELSRRRNEHARYALEHHVDRGAERTLELYDLLLARGSSLPPGRWENPSDRRPDVGTGP